MTRTPTLLREAAEAVDAPDVVFACSHEGHRTIVTAGTGTGTGTGTAERRAAQRYEIGSATKTYTGLLLAVLVHDGLLAYDEALATHLPEPATPAATAPGERPSREGHGRRRHHRPDPATLLHAASHTAGLPRVPADFYRQALPRWRTNPYARYPRQAVVDAFHRCRPGRRPGSRWRYSTLGVAVLGHALGHAAGSGYEPLLTRRVLRPLGMSQTALAAAGPDIDATGHRGDGRTPVPPAELGGFVAAGALRATPGDLLTYLEAHLAPETTALAGPLHDAGRPLLRRGVGKEHTHTLTWFHHPGDRGDVCFHAGATPGQEAFLGFRPATGTALVALSTRRHGGRTTLVSAAHELLTGTL